MKVFKNYFKIVPRKFLITFIIYVSIFLGLLTFFTYSEAKKSDEAFELSKIRVSVINRDGEPLSNNVEKYINEVFKPIKIGTGEEDIKDALFFRQTEVIFIIPSGFSKDFIKDESTPLQTMSVPNSVSGEYAKTVISSYLLNARLYLIANPELSADEVHEKVVKDVSVETKVSFSQRVETASYVRLYSYFSFLAFLMLSMIITIICRIMLIFNNKDVKRRNQCAPISARSYNFQLILSNFALIFIIYIIIIGLAFVITPDLKDHPGKFLYILNSFVLTLLCLSISFFTSSFATKTTVDAIANLLSLGMSFLGGTFVPHEILSDKLKNIVIFNPVYWYIEANDKITQINSITMSTVKPILFEMLLQLAFAATFLAVSLVIIKYKRTAD